MLYVIFTVLLSFVYTFAREPFQSLEGVVGYIVLEKGGKVENYLVVEEKDGSVRVVKTEKSPNMFLRKTEDEGKK